MNRYYRFSRSFPIFGNLTSTLRVRFRIYGSIYYFFYFHSSLEQLYDRHDCWLYEDSDRKRKLVNPRHSLWIVDTWGWSRTSGVNSRLAWFHFFHQAKWLSFSFSLSLFLLSVVRDISAAIPLSARFDPSWWPLRRPGVKNGAWWKSDWAST